ncbi:MAG TPA: COX15/CtaA family protein [Candidatus Acidoferrales bacterium]|nr:COX15/CtaA family protein [Candidatus Acidoferrales bacterium]
MSSDEESAARSPWPHRCAALTAATTMLLIMVGGLVTNTGSALAVPDWPTTFGYNMFTYPWSKMVGGVFYEHTHRLLGSTVGMLTIAMLVAVWRFEQRGWVRRLGLLALVGVIIQGILGGLRVILLEHDLAIVHGCFAQAFFALTVTLAVVTSSTWYAAEQRGVLRDSAGLRGVAILTAVLVYLQLVFGALLTHTGMLLSAHILNAGAVLLSAAFVGARVLYQASDRAELRRPAVLLFALLALQLSLGLGAYLWHFTRLAEVWPFEAGLALLAAHRLTGTAVWATSVVLALRVARASSVHAPAAHGLGHALVEAARQHAVS